MSVTVRERPILMSAPMVRATLADLKTQTRRLVKPQPVIDQQGNFTVADRRGNIWNWGQHSDGGPCTRNFAAAHCPYGRPGDRLWVRETFFPWPGLCAIARPRYRADEDRPEWRSLWKPSIHMPRGASRITLEVTEIRVERLQEISEADAIAEGSREPTLLPIVGAQWCERSVFAKLWMHIHGPQAWDANPWVWAVGFKRVQP